MCDPDAGRLLFSDLNAILTRSTLSDGVRYVKLTIESDRRVRAIFLCAGRAGFPEILQIFRAIFAQDLRHLDAGLAVYLASERTPTRTRAATKFCASRNHAGRVHATFARAARRKISGTLQFFRASWAENLRDPDAGRFPFRI